MAKIQRIISVYGLPEKTVKRLNYYCELLANKLSDQWLVSKDHIHCDVTITNTDYINRQSSHNIDPERTIILNEKNAHVAGFKYVLNFPVMSERLLEVLNSISLNKNIQQPIRKTTTTQKPKTFSFSAFFDKLKSFSFFSNSDSLKVPKPEHMISSQVFAERLSHQVSASAFNSHKIVFLGSPGSGKTTTMRSAGALKEQQSDMDTITHETTIGVDQGRISLDDKTVLNLISNPGQMGLGFMWDMTAQDADAFVIVLDMSHKNPLSELNFFMNMLKGKYNHKTILNCALTHCDESKHDLSAIKLKIVERVGNHLHLYQYDARNKEQSLNMIKDIGKRVIKKKAQNKIIPINRKRKDIAKSG